jgi:hypothetical protein
MISAHLKRQPGRGRPSCLLHRLQECCGTLASPSTVSGFNRSGVAEMEPNEERELAFLSPAWEKLVSKRSHQLKT